MEYSNPKRWGTRAWNRFHRKALSYPKYPCQCDIDSIYEFYTVKFLEYIDCGNCRNDYIRNINSHPLRYASRSELFAWTVDIHNIVNAKLNKPQLSYEQAYQNWSEYNSSGSYTGTSAQYYPQTYQYDNSYSISKCPRVYNYGGQYGGYTGGSRGGCNC